MISKTAISLIRASPFSSTYYQSMLKLRRMNASPIMNGERYRAYMTQNNLMALSIIMQSKNSFYENQYQRREMSSTEKKSQNNIVNL